MESVDLNKLKKLWQNSEMTTDKELSERAIRKYIHGRSRSINEMFKKGLWTDIVFKSIILLSLLVLFFLYKDQSEILWINTMMSLLLLLSISYQYRVLKSVLEINQSEASIKQYIELLLAFYRTRFRKALYFVGISAPFFFLNAVFYYFYFEYGKVRTFDTEDLIVFSSAVVIAYLISTYSQLWQFNFQVSQLKEVLRDLNEGSFNALDIRDQKHKRFRLTLGFILAFILGILVLLYFIFN